MLENLLLKIIVIYLLIGLVSFLIRSLFSPKKKKLIINDAKKSSNTVNSYHEI